MEVPTKSASNESWTEVTPDPTIKPKELIGEQIRVWWPTLKCWYDGTIVGLKGTRHLIRYDDRSDDTPENEDEEYFEHLLGKKKVKWVLLKKGSEDETN